MSRRAHAVYKQFLNLGFSQRERLCRRQWWGGIFYIFPLIRLATMWQSTFPPRGKQELQVNFPVLRGKWHEVPKGGRPPPRRKVDLSVAKRRMRSHILKHDASSTAIAVPLPQPGKALKYRQNSKKFYTPCINAWQNYPRVISYIHKMFTEYANRWTFLLPKQKTRRGYSFPCFCLF